MPTTVELVAHGRSNEQLEQLLGADRLIYQDLPDLIEAVRQGNKNITRFDTSVFTGEYVTQDISSEYLSQLELFRSDAAKQKRTRGAQTVIELKNA
jgi:amidophosphoribosyltransferase